MTFDLSQVSIPSIWSFETGAGTFREGSAAGSIPMRSDFWTIAHLPATLPFLYNPSSSGVLYFWRLAPGVRLVSPTLHDC